MVQNRKISKCVMVIDEELPLGLIANTAAILGVTLGRKKERIVGSDVIDGSNCLHEGLITIPITILKGTKEKIKKIIEKMQAEDFSDILLVDFSNAAQSSPTYETYTEKVSIFTSSDLEYLGISLYGDSKKVKRLTGNLPLLR